jgi:hypothetical protein
MSPLAALNAPVGGLEAKSVRIIWNVVTALLEEVEVAVEETLDVEEVSLDDEREAVVDMLVDEETVVDMLVDEEAAVPRLPHSK